MHRVANMHRHDMAAVVDDRQAQAAQPQFQDAGIFLLLVAQVLRGFQILDRRGGTRRHGGRQ